MRAQTSDHCHGGSSSRSSSSPQSSRAYGFSGDTSPRPSSELVRAAQTLLNHLGCDAGVVDGSAGSQTVDAVSRFNQASGGYPSMAVDGELMLRLAQAVERGQRCLVVSNPPPP